MIDKLRNFAADKRGTYTTLFAIASLPIFGAGAAALEYSNVYKAKFHLQHALDTAALATAKEIASSQDQAYLQAYARNFFDANLNDMVPPEKVTFTFNLVNETGKGTRIKLRAKYPYDTYMAGIIGVDRMDLDVGATVAAGNRTVEVAIVIDNSGSMDTETGGSGYTRLEKAKQAATDLINTLHTVAAFSNKPDPVKIAVVPFAGSVNVGPQYRGADWLDMNGWSSVHHENITWKASTIFGDDWPGVYSSGTGWKSNSTTTVNVGPNPPNPLPDGITSWNSNWLTRWTLFDAIQTGWAGCVEMRPWPYHTTDASPDALDPDTLFVPMFAADEPHRENSNEDNDYTNNYLDDYVRVGPDQAKLSGNYGSNTKQVRRQLWPRKYNLDARRKYNNGNLVMGSQRSRDFGDYGPNMGCTTDPVLPLTTSQTASLNAIDAMQPGGYTNVQAGIAWGWRMLSAGAPFTQGRGYDVPENDKFLIVLTDGNNTFPSQSTANVTEYYSWGYGRKYRARDGVAVWGGHVPAMDEHTATTCANLKTLTDADNEPAIKVFTIAYDVPNGSSVKTLLYNCASVDKTGTRFYYDVQGDALADAMAAIGNEISELRIAE